MPIITAKYASTCPACGDRIRVGERIEWTRGNPARHPECSAPASTSRRRYECDECGEYVTPGTRCWETGHTH